MPSGKADVPIIEDNRDGTVSVRYNPREEGLHELHVKYNSEHVQGEYGTGRVAADGDVKLATVQPLTQTPETPRKGGN